MKRLLAGIFFVCTFSVYGQDVAAVKTSRFYIGASFSPDYCYRTLTKNQKSTSNDTWKREKNLEDSIAKPEFGFTTGFSAGFQMNEKLSLETGIFVSSKGSKTIPINTLYYFNSSVYTNYPVVRATNILHYYYLDIPFRVKYIFLQNRFQIIAGAGADVNIFLQYIYKVIPENPTADIKTIKRQGTYDYNSVNLSPAISIGFSYKINDKISLRAEPTFRYSLFGIDKRSSAAIHFWSAGIQTGIYLML